MKKLGIIIALESEARSILDSSGYRWRPLPEPGAWASESLPLVLCLSGVGKVYASWAYTRLCADTDAIVSMGTSGGLSDEPVGSVFRISEFIEHDMCVESMGCKPGVTPYGPLSEAIMGSSAPWLDELLREACLGAGVESRPGRAIAGDEFLTDPARAARKRDYFGAQVVDMESAGMAKLALSRSHKPFAALRIVSDNANHDSGADWKANLAMAARLFDAVLSRLGAMAGEGR
jgi:adenosylhomocysteine nucleosidase